MSESAIWPAEGERLSLAEVPTRSASDYAYAAAKGALGFVPAFGGPLAELFVLAVGAPLEKRRQDWIRRIAEGLEDLQQRFEGFDPARLPENEAFVSTAYQATQAVMRTHYEQKREALRNVVLNAAVRTDIDEHLQQTFVGLVDTFTPLHLRLLRLLQDPAAMLGTDFSSRWIVNSSSASMMQVADIAFPSLKDQHERLDQITRELHGHGLSVIKFLGGAMSPMQTRTKRTTPLGDSFLSFITAPQPTGVVR